MEPNTRIDARLEDIEEEWFGQECHNDMQWLIALVRLQRLALMAVQTGGIEKTPRHIQALVSTALKGKGLPDPMGAYASEPEITLVFSVPPEVRNV